ncbi:uncharacterized protein MICPUCDRAFT_53020 [Micromonas pusilla CCMP1545]|uniref:Predicted protein n=1 Tax=Micromonas pusilla (strain CCMP1545) TaxID=564608 RepID=C1N5S4_MICPC|nr:uncharacterized protein MICPUCDRAFT_53020 [Micromonas pusilla CCMP1545]EEH52551.1 predicted protein [Micromonas pusilla CCMP1545]|tara:strand:+ start:188 stop:610 length:423 start_codon:yes stop_codon:yes gene_type:complete|eukprot:XP_003063415.1 predicted protein [Micromonas pusilla CCMP1545]
MSSFARTATPANALKAIDSKQKHLRMLLCDRLETNAETYGDGAAMPGRRVLAATTEGGRESDEQDDATTTTEADARDDDDDDDDDDASLDPKYWFPPYAKRGALARDLSTAVSRGRTPTGDFVETINPALHPPPGNGFRR